MVSYVFFGILLVTVPLICLAYICEWTTDEAGQTVKILQNLAIERYDIFGEDVRAYTNGQNITYNF